VGSLCTEILKTTSGSNEAGAWRLTVCQAWLSSCNAELRTFPTTKSVINHCIVGHKLLDGALVISINCLGTCGVSIRQSTLRLPSAQGYPIICFCPPPKVFFDTSPQPQQAAVDGYLSDAFRITLHQLPPRETHQKKSLRPAQPCRQARPHRRRLCTTFLPILQRRPSHHSPCHPPKSPTHTHDWIPSSSMSRQIISKMQ
jgi:hypothetical protein